MFYEHATTYGITVVNLIKRERGIGRVVVAAKVLISKAFILVSLSFRLSYKVSFLNQ